MVTPSAAPTPRPAALRTATPSAEPTVTQTVNCNVPGTPSSEPTQVPTQNRTTLQFSKLNFKKEPIFFNWYYHGYQPKFICTFASQQPGETDSDASEDGVGVGGNTWQEQKVATLRQRLVSR